MLVTKKMRSMADYSAEGCGSSLLLLALCSGWVPHEAIAIFLIIVCGLPGFCLLTPARLLPLGPVIVHHALLLGPVQALQFL